jgi:hypothetical protein
MLLFLIFGLFLTREKDEDLERNQEKYRDYEGNNENEESDK